LGNRAIDGQSRDSVERGARLGGGTRRDEAAFGRSRLPFGARGLHRSRCGVSDAAFRGAQRSAVPEPERHADPGRNCDPDAVAERARERQSDAERHRLADGDAEPDPLADADAHTVSDSDPQPHAVANADTEPDPLADPDRPRPPL